MLTEAGIKAAIRKAQTSDKAQIVLKDGGARGTGRLALIVRQMAARVSSEWYAIYFRSGKRRLSKIGVYPSLGLSEARERFRREYEPTIAAGAEPKNQYARATNGKASGSVEALFEAYLATLENPQTHYLARRLLLDRGDSAANVIGRNRPAASITADDITPLLAAIYQRGKVTMASGMRAWLQAAFAYGVRSANDYTKQNNASPFGIKINPVTAIPSDPEAFRAGTRFLSPSEIRAFWQWCESGATSSQAVKILMLMVCLGQRVQEVARISADFYGEHEALITWPMTKNGRPHTIPLPRQAVKILSSITPNEKGLFFPGGGDSATPINYTSGGRVITQYIQETGASHFSPRDLRRTWKTLAGRAGVSKEVRDKLQNHARHDVSSKHYDRYDYIAEKRAGMKAWETFLAGVLTGKITD